MIWALLAAFLTRRPPWVQACVVGLCSGLFVAAFAQADNNDPHIAPAALLVVVVGVVAGGLFYAGLRTLAQATDGAVPTWVTLVYVLVWVLSIVAAVLALFNDGGLKVAALAIVPIVLLAPTALAGIRMAVHRRGAAPPNAA